MVKCDFCGCNAYIEGKKKNSIRTRYGSGKYVRIMCEECKERIRKEHQDVGESIEIEELK